MKFLIILPLCFLFVGCYFSSVKKKTYVSDDSIPGSTITTATTSFYANEGSKGTYKSTQKTGFNVTCFKSFYQFTTTPSPEINIGLHLEKSNAQFSDTITTPMLLALMDLENVKKIQLDSITYSMDDNAVKVRFIIMLERLPSNHPVSKERYTVVYSSAVVNPKASLLLDKVEKSSVEVFGNRF